MSLTVGSLTDHPDFNFYRTPFRPQGRPIYPHISAFSPIYTAGPPAIDGNMQVRSFVSLQLLITIFFIMAIAIQIYMDRFVHTSSLFIVLLAGTFLSSVMSLVVNIDVPA